MSFIFPFSVREGLSIAVAGQLQTFLEEGSEQHEMAGLNAAPLFTVRQGSGAPGDESLIESAQVIFPDDDAPGVPHVKIAQVFPNGTPSPWGDTEESSRWTAVLDCRINDFQGGINAGHAPGGADDVLSDAVWNLVSNYDAMEEMGFYDSNATPGAQDMQGISYQVPITLTFEIYCQTQ
jgi:hypothetical protein